MYTRQKQLFAFAGVALALLTGCSNGSKSVSSPSASGSASGKGSVKITIHWPDAPASRQSRLIPAASNSINIQFKGSNPGNNQSAFSTSTLVERPASGNTSTVTVTNLPQDTYTETATAYPGAQGTGVAQATGSISNISVKASQLTTTPDLTMNTTIKTLTVTPSATTATAGGAAVSLTATAMDASGSVVLTAPGNIAFVSDKATFATLSTGNNPATLTPLAAGTVNVTATETESKVTSAAVAIVISAAGGGSGGGTGGGGTGGGTTTNPLNVFVADTGNSRLVGLNAIPATAFTPSAFTASSVALDAQGRIYFTNGVLIYRMDDINGTNLTTYRNSDGNTYDVTLDKQGRIYFYSDLYTLNRIDDMTGANHVTYNPTNESGQHLLNGVSGVAVDSQNRIYVTLSLSGKVMRMDDMTGANTVTFGTRGSGVNQFQSPAQIVLDSSNRIYVADAGNHRVARFDDLNGTNWTTFAIPSTVSGSGANFEGVAVDSGTSPHIYFTDAINGVIYRMDDMSGANLTPYGAKGAGNGQFNFPDNLAVK